MKTILHLMTVALFLGVTFNSNAQVLDGGFEAGPSGGAWTEASTNFGTPFCDLATCGDCGGPCVANTGSFYIWLGGATTIEIGSVEQSAVITAGSSASIDMMVKIAGAGLGLIDDKLEVSIDGSVVATVTAQDSVAYADYTLLSVDATSVADGGSHTIKIEGTQTTATVFNVLVDDVVLVVDGNQVVGLFENVTEPEFVVYPNPAADVVNIQFGELTGDVTAKIITLTGAVVSNQTLSNVYNKSFTFNTSALINGVYFVEITNEGNVTTERIVISK